MKLSEAIAALEAGKKVRIKTWPHQFWLKYESGRVRDQGDDPYEFEGMEFELDWELYEEPGHDFAWALEQLKAGKKVKRRGWNGQITPVQIGQREVPTYESMIATDWELA